MRFLTVLCLAVAGCSPPQPPMETANGGVRVSSAGGVGSLYSVTMPDGTRCVAFVGYQKGGVDCEFTDTAD